MNSKNLFKSYDATVVVEGDIFDDNLDGSSLFSILMDCLDNETSYNSYLAFPRDTLGAAFSLFFGLIT